VPGARPIRAPAAAAAAEALQIEGAGEEFRGTVLPEVTRVVASLVDGSERELTIEAGSVSHRAATPHESARTVQAFADDQLVASVTLEVACGGSAGPCAPAAAPDAAPTYAFVGELPSGQASLVRVDPRTLAPIGRGLLLGEVFAPLYARSLDGAEVALAVAGKPLVKIVDLASLRVTRTLRLGAAGDEARALAWLRDDRLVAVVQRMSQPTRRYVRARAAVTLDPTSGRIIARRALTNKLAIGGIGVGSDRLVLMLRSSSNNGSTVELAVVGPDGGVRTRSIEVGKTRGVLNATALAVESSGKRAFLFGWAIERATPPVLEVDLDTLKATRRVVRVEQPGSLAPAGLSTLHVGPAADGFVVAFGAIGTTARSEGTLRPAAGLFVIDTRSWTAKQLDRRASYFKIHGGRVVTYGPSSDRSGAQAPHGSGVSVYELPGRRLFHLYANRPFQRIELADDYGHVLFGRERTKRLVFNASAGEPLGMLPAIREPIEVLPPVDPAAKTRAPSAATAGPTAARLQGDASELRAFKRPKQPSDVLSGRFADHLEITDSRRIATYVDRRGRRATLYVAKGGLGLCQVLVKSSTSGGVGGGGGGCSPPADFLNRERHVAASSGRLFAGVVANEVARVVIVGSRGVRHPVKVTADGGFIYDCRAYNGCAGLIACVEAYTRDGTLLSGQPWEPGGCRRRS